MKQFSFNIISIFTFFMLGSLFANDDIDSIFKYLYPVPNSIEVRPQTSIIIRIDQYLLQNLKKEDSDIQLIGSMSGLHKYKKILINNSLILKPIAPFELGEKIDVKIQLKVLDLSYSASYSFLISNVEFIDGHIPQVTNDLPKLLNSRVGINQNPNEDPTVINGISVPSGFPILIPSINNSNSTGKIFMTNYSGDSYYIMIFENDGTPYYYKKLLGYSVDFKLQNNGELTHYSSAKNGFLILNKQYEEFNLVKAQNGYITDAHDFLITKDSTYFLIGLGSRIMNLAEAIDGGQTNAIVVENIIQELDFDQNVIFEWRSLDQRNYDDITSAIHTNFTEKYIDPAHINSIAIDYDNNILISSRHRSECTKIDRTTGEVIWRFGGVNNQFEIINDSKPFSYQHTFYPVTGKPNYYTLFDNGNFSGKVSRAIEYKIDPINFKAEKIWEYQHKDNLYAFRAGSVQRLSNGNTLNNFVQPGNSKAVEVDSIGNVVYEADIDPSLEVHRTFKFKWESEVDKPYLITELFENKVRLLFNKFGDTDVSSYNIYGGSNPQEIALIDSTQEPWFDVSTTTLTQSADFYFSVTAINSVGEESEFSNTESVLINNPGNGNSLGILGDSEFEDPNDPIWSIGKPQFNNALSFTNSDQLVNCGNDPTIQISGSKITIQANIFPSSFEEEPWESVILSKERGGVGTEFGYTLRSGGNGVVEFLIGDGDWKLLSTPTGAVEINTWNSITATYDGVFQRIYINGALKAKSNNFSANIIDAANSNFIIGNSSFYQGRGYNGSIDEVRLWNKTLTETEIINLMNTQLGAEYYSNPNSGLVGYWRLNEGTGQITEDLAKDNNIVLNGDFSSGINHWNLVSENSAVANGLVNAENYYNALIENGGSGESSVKLSQNNLILIKNNSYTLEFDAWSVGPKFIILNLRQAEAPWKDYSKIGAVFISETQSHFEYQFEMTDNSDNNAEIAFMIGGNNIDFFLDNVSLRIDDITNIDLEININNRYQLKANYPNPFNPTTTIEYILPKESMVNINVFNILGELVNNFVNSIQKSGNYNKIIDMKNFSSGIYFYSIIAKSISDDEQFHKVKKMILLK